MQRPETKGSDDPSRLLCWMSSYEESAEQLKLVRCSVMHDSDLCVFPGRLQPLCLFQWIDHSCYSVLAMQLVSMDHYQIKKSIASVRTMSAQGASERLARRARERAHQQWAHAAPNVVCAAGRFPRTSHEQHPIYF